MNSVIHAETRAQIKWALFELPQALTAPYTVSFKSEYKIDRKFPALFPRASFSDMLQPPESRSQQNFID